MIGGVFDSFREIWSVDFEFRCPPGERPSPICMVAREYRSGRTVKLWEDDLASQPGPPWANGTDVLLVAYYASAELGCYLALGWQVPARVLDLFVEFRNLANGKTTLCGGGLLGALASFGIDGIEAVEKKSMQDLAQRGGPYTEAERTALLMYCESDVIALEKLMSSMMPLIDLPRALLRGRYMAAAARMEWTGVPVDRDMLGRLIGNWETIKNQLVKAINADYAVYVPTGQRKIDPTTKLGTAILETAKAYNVDPHKLLLVVDDVWEAERSPVKEIKPAIEEARRVSGLTIKAINRWEDAGKDSASWPQLDTTARELAGALPALGIGPGFRQEADYDDNDYPGRLWELLREPIGASKPKHHPDILSEAADLLLSHPDWEHTGPMTFSADRFAAWLIRTNIPWPRLESGALDLSDDTFRQMARRYPAVAPLRELRHTLSQLRLNDLAVGADGRNRCLLSAFRAKTGRNQPSNSMFIFGPSCWLRALIRPEPGRALAYVDWEQQEFGIAAALSGDSKMLEAYASGDPYLTFAVQAGAVPRGATKHTHKEERDRFKICALAVQYGMGEKSLAQSIGRPDAEARELLRLHRQTYPAFWRWSQAAVDHAMLHGWLQTVFGWRIHVGADANPRSLANFPMQANGAEMLRLACCLATERGIAVCAPIHDAVLVEGPEDEIEVVVAETQLAMREASEIVLSGFPLRTDAKIVRPGERYLDPRGVKMWETVQALLVELAAEGLTEAEEF